jgi:hypothetical protein
MLIENGMYMTGASGADKGASTINASAIYDDGVLLANQVAATQAELETGSSTSVFTSPGRQQFHQSAAKGWVMFNMAASIQASYNVSSVTDVAAGDFTINWATDFSSATYVAVGTLDLSAVADRFMSFDTPAVGTIGVNVQDSSGATETNVDNVMVVAFGDQ